MTTDPDRLKYLLEHYAEDSCTRQELDELFFNIREAKNNDQLQSFLENEWSHLKIDGSIPDVDWNKMFSEIISVPTSEAQKQKRKSTWWIAAASFLIIVSLGTFVILNKREAQHPMSRNELKTKDV